MFDDYRRCDTCIHHDCPADCTKCCMLKAADELPSGYSECGCVAYQFDANGDCRFYEYNTYLEDEE